MQAFIKNFIIIFGLIALATIGYYLFVVENDANLDTATIAESTRIDVESQQFLRKLVEIQGMRISNALFADPAFLSLKNFGEVVTPVELGREDPFRSAESSGDSSK